MTPTPFARLAPFARPLARRPACRLAALAVSLPLLAGPALAQVAVAAPAGDATLDQVYAAAHGGHLAEARQMMATVLHDHPRSARAHFVEAELLGQQGDRVQARAELDTAQRLAPGLPFARADAVQALQRELDGRPTAPTRALADMPTSGSGHQGALSLLAAVLGGALLAWLLSRLARPQPTAPTVPMAQPFASTAPAAPTPSAPAAPAAWGAAGAWPMPPQMTPPMTPAPAAGLGPQVAAGLTTGLAAGAGLLAAEALGHRWFGGGGASTVTAVEPAVRLEPLPDLGATAPAPDPGGADFGPNISPNFGISEGSSGGGWDDGSGSSDWDI